MEGVNAVALCCYNNAMFRTEDTSVGGYSSLTPTSIVGSGRGQTANMAVIEFGM